MDDLRTRIAAVIADELERQSREGGYAHRYTPLDDDGNEILDIEFVAMDAVVDPAVLADAVIRELESFAEPTHGRDDQWLDADIHIAYDAPGTPIAIEQDPGEVICVTANYARKMAAALLLAANKSDWLHDESRWLKENDND